MKHSKRTYNAIQFSKHAWIAGDGKIYCANCGSDENIHFHHIVPFCNGGNDVPSNMIPLCHKCHSLVHYGRNNCFAQALGRKSVPPDGYEKILDKYFKGEIGSAEAKIELHLTENCKLSWYKWYREYRKQHQISSKWRNTKDMSISAINRHKKNEPARPTPAKPTGVNQRRDRKEEKFQAELKEIEKRIEKRFREKYGNL